MKRFVALFVGFVMTVSLSGCGGTTSSGGLEGWESSSVVQVNLQPVSDERAAFEVAIAVVTQLYAIARLRTDELAEYEVNEDNLDEVEAKVNQVMESWEVVELAADRAIEAADYADELEASMEAQDSAYGGAVDSAMPSSPSMTIKSPGGSWDSWLFPVAHAAEEDAAVKWAEDLMATYDSFDSREGLKKLGEHLGTDARSAFKQLKIARDIMEGNMHQADADYYRAIEVALLATKTACKVGLYIGAGGPGGISAAVGVLAKGGAIISAVDVAVDIGATTTNIVLGANNQITLAIDKVADAIAPISALTGATCLFNSNKIGLAKTAAEKFGAQMDQLDRAVYVAESLNDYVQEGSILGGLITVNQTEDVPEGMAAPVSIDMVDLDVEGLSTEEVQAVLADAGLPVAEPEDKSLGELADQYEGSAPMTPQEVDDLFNEMEDFVHESITEEAPRVSAEERRAKGTESDEEDFDEGDFDDDDYYFEDEEDEEVAYLKMISGTYQCGIEGWESDWDFPLTISPAGGGNLNVNGLAGTEGPARSTVTGHYIQTIVVNGEPYTVTLDFYYDEDSVVLEGVTPAEAAGDGWNMQSDLEWVCYKSR